MKMINILTEEGFDRTVIEFLEMPAEICEEEDIRDACVLLIKYITP